jgi:cellulose biosynthesis protein BcsQ
MALVNVAHVLALQSWRVLLVDFDLEAPGMTHFFARDVRRRPSHVRKDSLDLLLEARRTLEEADQQQKSPEYPRSLAEYTVPLTLPDAWQEKLPEGIPYRNGRIDLIPATLEPHRTAKASEEPPSDYLERLGELDLASLFEPGGPGHRFGDHVRRYFTSARFEAPGDILFTLRTTVQATYDIVLIDSRTGLNEIAGFSIGTVADALVLCCGLNQQNIEGTRYFMRKAGLFKKRAKRFLVAVGPVPPWSQPEVEQRLQVLSRALRLSQDSSQPLEAILDKPEISEEEDGGLDVAYESPELVQIPYHPLAALRETIFIVDLSQDPIAQAYVRLAGRLKSRLLPGAVEAAQLHMYLLDLMRKPGSEYLRLFSRFAAERLPELRLLREQGAPVPTFPTAYTVISLPKLRRELRWEDMERIPIAAAVSALHLKSPGPYERAWRFIRAIDNESHKRYLAHCLVYFQCSTSYGLPEAGSLLLGLEGSGIENLEDLLSVLAGYVSSRKAMVFGPGKRVEIKDREEFAKLLFGVLPSTMLRWASGRHSASETMPHLIRAVERLASGTLNGDPESLEFLKELYRLPAEPADILRGKTELSKLGSSVFEAALTRAKFSFIPLGFWPEPLAATALAIADGTKAIEEILAWLHLARLHYGYAWRVLTDWRYFDEVKQHSRFQTFLREEDEVVAEIEGQIDSGYFPL